GEGERGEGESLRRTHGVAEVRAAEAPGGEGGGRACRVRGRVGAGPDACGREVRTLRRGLGTPRRRTGGPGRTARAANRRTPRIEVLAIPGSCTGAREFRRDAA